MTFPKHDGGLTLEHNPHKGCYETIQHYVQTVESGGAAIGWVSDDQRQKAIAQDSLWVLQWYPDTPIGFLRLAACDLGLLLEAANKE